MINNFDFSNIFQGKNSSNIFKFFKTTSPKFNLEIKNTLSKFKNMKVLSKNLAKIDIQLLLSNLEKLKLNISNIYSNEEFNYNNSSEKFVLYLTKIYISINIIIKIEEILSNILISTKNYFSNFSIVNKHKIKNQEYISNYLDNLQYFYSNQEISTPKFSDKSYSSIENNSTFSTNKNDPISFSYFCKYGSNQKNIPIKIFDIPSDDEEYSHKKLKIGSGKTIYEFPIDERNPERKFSELTFAQIDFKENEINKKPSPLKRKNSNANYEIHVNKNRNYEENNIKIFRENFEDKQMFKELLELIYFLYKNCLINSEEKLKLKEIIISKSQKIKKIYVNYFIEKKYNKSKVVSELKKLIQ